MTVLLVKRYATDTQQPPQWGRATHDAAMQLVIVNFISLHYDAKT